VTTGYDFSTPDLETLLNEDRFVKAEGGGDSVFWRHPTTKGPDGEYTLDPLKLYFVTNYWNYANDHGWFFWREVNAEEGLAGGIKLQWPNSEFPVRDVRDLGNGQQQYIKDSDPDADELYKLVVPFLPKRTKAKRPFRPVRDKAGINILKVVEKYGEDGKVIGTDLYHQVLVMPASRAKKLLTVLKGYREMVPNFDATAYPFTLTVTGKGAGEVVGLTPHKDEPAVELPDPFDIPEHLQAKREEIFAIVTNWTGVDTAKYQAADPWKDGNVADAPAFAQPEGQYVDELAPSSDAAPQAPERPPYESMPPARLKTLLMKAGIAIPPKATREQLVELAIASL
jgi:hypothetical protein